jgi:hypothetical protein
MVVDEHGNNYLFEPLNLTSSPKEKIHLELLRELRQLVTEALPFDTKMKVFCYQGIVKCGQEYGLLLAYNEELWLGWSKKGQAPIPPPQVAAVAEGLLEILEAVGEEELTFPGFYPGDLVPLGDSGWGILDPRVQRLLAPYRSGGEQRDLYMAPETLGGDGWTEVAYLYTLGLTLYRLATGKFPFPLEKRQVTVTAMLREEVLDPRYEQPQIGAGLAELIMKLLKRNRAQRPDTRSCAAALVQATNDGTLEAGPDEVAQFQVEAKAVKARVARKRQQYWRWQRYRWPMIILVGLAALFLLLSRGGYKEQITPSTPPLEVVQLFYDGLARLEPSQLEEPLAKGVGKEFTNMVSVLHVTYKIRQAYERIDLPSFQLEDLSITTAEGFNLEAPTYTAVYRLQFLEGDVYVKQERRDWLVLEKRKKRWRITRLDSKVLTEERESVTTNDKAETFLSD